MAKPLTRDEEDLAGLLHRLGLTRPAAQCLVAMLREAPMLRADLASATGLAPQAVSDATHELERLGLIMREPVTTGAKGRPQLRHRLPATAKDALRRLETDRRQALMEELALLDELRRRST